MALMAMSPMLHAAQEGNYALGYFEAWDQYSLEAVLEAAEEAESPVVLGVGGMFVEPAWFDRLGLASLGALGRTIADRAHVPVALLLNEVHSLAQVVQGIMFGFNAVMVHSAQLPFGENIALTRQVVQVAHAVGVAVQGELGELPDASADSIAQIHRASLTDAEQAQAFVHETGVDALAVSVGNVHMLLGKECQIDFDRLHRIRRMTNVPLVIHGGSSFPTAVVAQAIDAGVALFHVGTILRKSFLDGVKAGCDAVRPDAVPQRVIGSHMETDVLVAGKASMKDEVAQRIRLYGSAGKAATMIQEHSLRGGDA